MQSCAQCRKKLRGQAAINWRPEQGVFFETALHLTWTSGVFGPFERKLTKVQRCRIFTPLGNRTYRQRDLPGPPTYQGWLAAWRVLKTACLILNVVSLAALEVYGRHIEKLVTQWPSAWCLIYRAEDAARAERMAKMRRQFAVEAGLGHQVPRDCNPDSPWSCIFIQITKDEAYWSEKVHIPASAWVAAGARGQPVVATEVAVKAHVPGLQDSISDNLPPGHDGGDHPKRQSNKDTGAARKRKFQADMEGLRHLRQGHGAQKGTPNSGGKGSGRKEQRPVGYSDLFLMGIGSGARGKLPPEADCSGPIKRAHKCRKCLSPSHQDADCNKP